MILSLTNEFFALRDSEQVRLIEKWPSVESGIRFIGVMVMPVTMPDGEKQEKRPSDGAPVESAAILACERVRGKWQWLQLGAVTKEAIGDFLFDVAKVERGVWHCLEITSVK